MQAGPIQFYHAFILEQFSADDGRVRTRLYQSWLNELTMKEHFEAKRYDKADEGCFDESELAVFFTNLRGLLFCGKTQAPNQQVDCQSACFNVIKQSAPPPGNLDMAKGIYSGLSLRFFTSKIDPQSISYSSI